MSPDLDAIKQLDGCTHTVLASKYFAGVLYCLNFSWFSAFNFVKNMKYACDRKFTVPKIIKIELGLQKLLQK